MFRRLILPLLGAVCFATALQGTARAAELLITEDFANCGFSGDFTASYVRSQFYPAGTAPFVSMDGHGCVLHQRIPTGVDDITPAQVGLEGSNAFQRVTGSPEVDEFYVEWEEYYPSNHDFADGAQKMLRFVRENGPQLLLQNQYNNGNLQIHVYHPNGVDTFQNSRRSVPTDRWVSFAVWCRLNTPGKQDGFCRAYMDNEQIINMSNINMRGNSSQGYNIMWVGGNHTNQKPTVKTSSRFIDNIRWYDTKPNNTPTPTPPPAATPAPEPTPPPAATPPSPAPTPKPTPQPRDPAAPPSGQKEAHRPPCDFDGDGRSDFRVVRKGNKNSATLFTKRTGDGGMSVEAASGSFSDVFIDADVDADRVADAGTITTGHRNMNWVYRHSYSSLYAFWPWGEKGDIPVTPDIDGDRVSDSTIFRPRDGTWWSIRSAFGAISLAWGLPGDLPVADDYDGDGWDDIAVFRPGTAFWAVLKSTRGASPALPDIIWKQWGLPGDHPMTGDYDGDYIADLMVYRPSNGYWLMCGSRNGFNCEQSWVTQFGLPGDKPVRGDFDGDEVLDLAVWRPANGTWYYRRSRDGGVEAVQWGLPGDWPLCAGIKDTADRM